MDVMAAFEKAVQADDAAGAAFIDAVVYDFMADQGELVRKEITELYAVWALDRVQVAKRALGRKYVTAAVEGERPSSDINKATEWLNGIEKFVYHAAISKGEYWDIDGEQVFSTQPRDALGRFGRGISQDAEVTMLEMTGDPDRMSPTVRGAFDDNNKPLPNITDKDKALVERHQGQWEEATRIVSQFSRDFEGKTSGVGVAMTLSDDKTGVMRQIVFPLSDMAEEGGASGTPRGRLRNFKEERPRLSERILTVELIPSRKATAEESARVAMFNTLGGIGGPALASLANVDNDRANTLRNSLKMPTTQRDRDEQKGGLLGRFFNMIGAGGSVLEQVTGAEKLGEAARFVGTLGPQAQTVLGPYVQQAAYRYRGTEVTPDPGIMRMADANKIREYWVGNPALPNPAGGRPIRDASSGRAASVIRGGVMSEDQLAMQVRADQASAYLQTHLPDDPMLARLSEESGQVLPSRGVLFNNKGEGITEAVGFTDDHYLPFDLKNLGELRGGQYVRTRVNGGLTGEDIYAAVTMGARQVQVVSGSGVFTLEMQPDFRGARSMSDKARSMHDRYLKILDAVENSGLYLEDVSGARQDELRREAAAEARYGGDAKKIFESKLADERASMNSIDSDVVAQIERNALMAVEPRTMFSTVIAADLAAAKKENEKAVYALKGKQRRNYDDTFQEMYDQAVAAKTNKLRLNGQGYKVALQTLQAQFPHFIRRVDSRTLNELPGVEDRAQVGRTRMFAEDRGYVEPGALRAKPIRAGFIGNGSVVLQQKRKPKEPESTTTTETTDSSAPTTSSGVTPPADNQNPGDAVTEAASVPYTDSGMGAQAAQTRDMRVKALKAQIHDSFKDFRAIQPGMRAELPVDEYNPALSDEDVAFWLLANMSSDAVDAVLTNPGRSTRAIQALSNEDAVRSAVSRGYQPLGGQDGVATLLVNPGGETTLEGVAAYVVEESAKIGEMAALFAPLVVPSGDPATAAWHTGVSAQALDEIKNIGDKESFNTYAGKNPEIYDQAVSLALTKSGAHTRIGTIGRVVSERIEALKAVADGQRKYAATDPVKDKAIRTNVGTFVSAKDWAKSGLPGAHSIASLTAAQPQQAAMDQQRAWALAVTGRAIEAEGGDVFPKDEARLLKPRVSKATRVLDWEDPRSVAMRDRISKGLPPVPLMR